jgi:transposase
MTAVTQIRNHATTSRAYYDRKLTDGMAPKSALRALKRKISDALYTRMIADSNRAAHPAAVQHPGGQSGNDSVSSAAGSHPDAPARTSHSRAETNPTTGRPTPQPAQARRPHRPSRHASTTKRPR